MNATADRFAAATQDQIDECHRLKYYPTRYAQMITEHGAVDAAKRVLHAPLADGFTTLMLRQRLDLTTEYLVSQQEFHELFSAEELGIALRRLGPR